MVEEAVIYLASQSPRRRELLQQIGIHFEVLPVSVDESLLPGEEAAAHVTRLALSKAQAGRDARSTGQDLPVLGADTVVVVAGEVLGKPADRTQGMRMLQLLSGGTHQVLSAVAVATDSDAVRLSTSSVTFRTLTDCDYAAYWATGESMGKAGGYAIQGLAAIFISRLEGSYSGVMGLPLYETAALLSEHGISVI